MGSLVLLLVVTVAHGSTWNARHWPTHAAQRAWMRNTTLTQLAFASCANVDPRYAERTALLSHVGSVDVFVWGGDAVYSDIKDGWLPSVFKPASLDGVQSAFDARKVHDTHYARLAATTPVLGMYDDHEFLQNWDRTLPHKEALKQRYLGFVDAPDDAPARRPGRGAYAVHTFGQGPRLAKLVLLDVRYDRHFEGDWLGEEQWAYLEAELAGSEAAVHVVVSPVRVLTLDAPMIEKWTGPHYVRLMRLLAPLRGVLLLSGDVHVSSLHRSACATGGRMLTELTSSGVTHTHLDQFKVVERGASSPAPVLTAPAPDSPTRVAGRKRHAALPHQRRASCSRSCFCPYPRRLGRARVSPAHGGCCRHRFAQRYRAL